MPESSTLPASIPGFIAADAVYTLDELQARLQIGKAAWRTARREGLPVRAVGRRKLAIGRDIIAWLMSKPLDLAT